MNVSTTMIVGSEKQIGRRVLVATKDFEAGDVIYKEQPVVTVLDFDLEGKGTHCSYCLKTIKQGTTTVPPSDRLSSAYCSKECLADAQLRHQSLLFTTTPPLPATPAVPPSATTPTTERAKAQEAFVAHLKETNKAFSLLTARFIARQVTSEITKMVPGLAPPPADLPQADENDYSINDHVERLRYLDLTVPGPETALMRSVLQTALPGLEAFVTDERHAVLLGKMAYNSYGVCLDGGRDDKPPLRVRSEHGERTRTPFGTERQVGSAFYLVSSYIGHSCEPSARPSFEHGTAELHLIANRAIKKDEVITVAYTDVSQRAGETVEQARQRRRRDLTRGWRFACVCGRCIAEGAVGEDGQDKDVAVGGPKRDESRVDDVVERLQSKQSDQ